MFVSVVIPCYYSEGMIEKVVRLTRDELINGGYAYEFILVNDGSTDGTFEAIERLTHDDRNIVGINCAKNLGQHSAIMAGLQKTRGDVVMIMDDDMQTHPSQCLKLLHAMENGSADVVFAKWPEHKEALWRHLGSQFTVWSMRVMTKRPKGIYASNFIVMRDYIRDEIVRYKGPYVYIQGLIFRATSNVTNIEVEHFAREMGQSGYNLKQLIRLWSIVLNFSMMPLRAASVSGVILGLIGLIGAIVIVIQKLANPAMQAGYASLMATIAVIGGMILIGLGVVGEYLGRMFMTLNNDPQFVTKRIIDNRSDLIA